MTLLYSGQWCCAFYIVTCLAILHCTAFLETAPLNATGCKIKDMIKPCKFGDAVKVHDVLFKF